MEKYTCEGEFINGNAKQRYKLQNFEPWRWLSVAFSPEHPP